MRGRRSRQRARIALFTATASALGGFGLTACASSHPASSPTANPAAITVVTGLYPLAQAAEQIGGRDAIVDDIVPAGVSPVTYQPTAADRAQLRAASLVLLFGGGFQPGLEAAAAADAAGHVVDLGTLDGGYVWLDPASMHKTVDAIATAMSQADPGAASGFRRNATDYTDEIDSTGIDYQSTLSVCPDHTIVTPDAAFRVMARSYGLTDQVVGTAASPSQASVSSAASAATAAQATTAFVEPFVETGTVTAVAGVAHLKLRTLDPLTGPPPAGWPAKANYISLMEANLGALSSALGCPNPALGS